jgi:FkbM family methyltransferase
LNIHQKRDGTWVPNNDHTCYDWTKIEGWIPKYIADACDELKIVRHTIIHAGGNMGLYTKQFAGLFDNVYVFEPEARNFNALCYNTSMYENVYLYRAALSNEHTTINLKQDADNCGITQVVPGAKGNIPTLMIDDLGLNNVSVIHLDIEGFELFAFKGAIETIKKFKPLICFETYGYGKEYGYTHEDIVKFLGELGYNISRSYEKEMMFYYGEHLVK